MLEILHRNDRRIKWKKSDEIGFGRSSIGLLNSFVTRKCLLSFCIPFDRQVHEIFVNRSRDSFSYYFDVAGT